MKKILLTFQIIILFILISPLQVNAQCPWNRVNCSHGCGRHIDENGDGFCDHSIIDKSLLQPKEEEKEVLKEIQQQEKIKKEEPTEISINKSQKNQKDKHNGIGLNKKNNETNSSQNENTANKKSETIDNQKIQDTITEEKIIIPIQKPSQKAKPYDLILISFITFVLYSITFILSKLNLLRKIYHRRIWNFILLLTFLISCLFGFFLVIQINYGFAMEWFRTVLYWHVQIGISMTIISVFHIFWHLKYFKNLLKKPKGC
ncbi:MAG: cytochrome b/b6 domain-containing protein [Bacteroidales bacterium]|nr:cytochrome b/b6 domain-containing protein [Bacteroidales bacterium]